ncbi:hypothetical protein [Streptomyces sp. NPDC007264]
MVIKKFLAAAGAAVVLVLGAAGIQHGVEQGPVAVAPADNTPWT